MIYKKIRQSKNKNGNKTMAKMVGSNPYAKHADIAGSVKKGKESSYDENNVYAQEAAAMLMKEPITKKASSMKLTQCKAAGPLKNVNELNRRTSSGNNSGGGDYDNRYKTGDVVVKDGKRYKVTESRTYKNTPKPKNNKPSSGPFKNPAVPGQTYQEFLDAPCPSPGKPLTNPHCQGQEGTQNIKLDPITNTETNTTPASQQYNMGYNQATNANWARGAMRRGLNRDERKAIKNKIQAMSNEDRERFRDEMKKQRKGTFLGLGIGGDRQERKIKALKNMGVLDPNYKSYKSEQADEILSMDTEERNQKIESATMNKYNIPINRYGDFKPGETTTTTFQEEAQEGDTQFEGVEGERQINFGDNNTNDSNTIKNDETNTDAVAALTGVMNSGPFFKLKNKGLGRGAGYKN
tara:strand:- start:975 stop:2198 length:1224 start_codon:yes stop_codon:yes gene_type:complete